ncbi:MAG: type II toxin-antitoxin system VapC family toxin [Isosphaeraceae bacterium]
MIVLDTQPVSQLQRAGSPGAARIEERLARLSPDEVWITIITPFEQFRGCLAAINAAKGPDEQLPPFRVLERLLDHYSHRWRGRILPFDAAAVREFQNFTPQLIRKIGARDARIAAIALAYDATVLTANVRDFRLVPGLKVEEFA